MPERSHGRTPLTPVLRHRTSGEGTGVAHLATAVRTPSVVLFGPTDPGRWGPPPALAERHVVLWAGRTGDPDAAEPDPGLLAISPHLVVDALATLTPAPGSAGTSR